MAEPFFSRGFLWSPTTLGEGRSGAARPVRDGGFPVLSAGPTPRARSQRGTSLPAVRRSGGTMDMGRVPGAATRARHHGHPLRHQVVQVRHRLGGRLGGHALAKRRARLQPAPYVLAVCDGGYTTNLPLADVTSGKAWVAENYDGVPLPPEHGGPARLLVPHLYFWKSAKWVRQLRIVEERRSRVLGVARLSQLRRPVARAAVRRRPMNGTPAPLRPPAKRRSRGGSPPSPTSYRRRRERGRWSSTSRAGPAIAQGSTSTFA